MQRMQKKEKQNLSFLWFAKRRLLLAAFFSLSLAHYFVCFFFVAIFGTIHRIAAHTFSAGWCVHFGENIGEYFTRRKEKKQ